MLQILGLIEILVKVEKKAIKRTFKTPFASFFMDMA
jgi:hypothetical protein